MIKKYGMETTGYSEQGNGTFEIKTLGDSHLIDLSAKSNNSSKYMPTCWTMYDHTSNKISNEYFYDNIYYSGTIPNKHFYPVDSSGDSSGYYDFNDNEFIDDIYDSSSRNQNSRFSSSFLVGECIN